MGFPAGQARQREAIHREIPEDFGERTFDQPDYLSPKLKNLAPHHQHMARLVACGARPGDLVALTGFSNGQISRVLGSPLFQALVAKLTGNIEENAVYNVREQLESLAGRSLEIVSADLDVEITNHAERVQRSRVAFNVLDRAGYSPKDTAGVSLHLHKHEHRDVSKMDTADLLSDVLEISNA